MVNFLTAVDLNHRLHLEKLFASVTDPFISVFPFYKLICIEYIVMLHVNNIKHVTGKNVCVYFQYSLELYSILY